MSRRGPTGGVSVKRRVTPAASFHDLTARQRSVAMLIGLGKFNDEIADELGIGIKTVDTHRSLVMVRLGLRNNVELALYLVKHGVIVVTTPVTVSSSELILGPTTASLDGSA